MNDKAMSYVLGAPALTIGVLAIGALIASGFLQKTGIFSNIPSSKEQIDASRFEEKLTLIHWSGAQSIISNDCKLSVTIVRVYVDNQVQPQSMTINAPSGSSLIVDTIDRFDR